MGNCRKELHETKVILKIMSRKPYKEVLSKSRYANFMAKMKIDVNKMVWSL